MITNKNKCSVIIAAAGEGTRLQPFTSNVNKPLFEYQGKPIIAHLIDQYKTFSDDIVVAASEDDKGRFLKAWLLDYYNDPKWLYVNFMPPPHEGTNKLVMDCLRLTKHQRTLVSWADFILNDNIGSSLKDQNIFFTANTTCRFSEENGFVKRNINNPGFIGLYYFAHKKPQIGWYQEDFLENYIGHPVKTQLINITNLGTIKELIDHKAFNQTSNRYFNHLEFTENEVIKTAIDDHGKKLQKIEADWYDHISDEMKPYVPKHKYHPETDQLVLERLDAKPISQIPPNQLGPEFWRKKLPELLNKLHTPAPIPVDIQSCVDTYINKPNERLAQVQRTINAWFDDGRQIVNGDDYTDWEIEMPCLLLPGRFTFGHGDLQFSNMMMNKNGNLFIIDPRGYFGNSKLYLDPVYDIVKLIYGAVDNYHKINEGNFLIGKSNNGTILVHNSNPITSDIRWFIDWAMDKYSISKEKLNYLLYTIWMSLPGYLKNSPRNLMGAYCMGLIRSKHFLIK